LGDDEVVVVEDLVEDLVEGDLGEEDKDVVDKE
jgi:hypothetical protein